MAKLDPNIIIETLPYQKPFLFVDSIESISETRVTGFYMFKKDEFFYEGHFRNNPITPGVILTECMAQIGIVCLGLYLLRQEKNPEEPRFALTNTEIDFYLPVFPGEKIKVVSEKIYFRFQKLKCNVKMLTKQNELIAKGTISGMILNEGNKI